MYNGLAISLLNELKLISIFVFQGDSGGPLITERKNDKRYELIGNEYSIYSNICITLGSLLGDNTAMVVIHNENHLCVESARRLYSMVLVKVLREFTLTFLGTAE